MPKNTLLILISCLLGSFAQGKDPAWFKDLRPKVLAESVTKEDPEAVVLRDERSTVISSSGTFTSTTSLAILIRKQEGFDAAVAKVPYYSDTDKILSFNAWTISPTGKVTTFKKDDFVDVISNMARTIATTARIRSINATRDVWIGTIFAYEAVVENKDIFSQDVWYFQGPYPILSSGISYEFPEGWEIKPLFFNMDPLVPEEKQLKRTRQLAWTLHSIPRIKSQPYSPAHTEVVKWAAFDIVPSEKSQRELFQSWKEISMKKTPIYDSLTVVSAEMEAEVEKLTANSTGTIDSIRTLSELAQKVTYISIALDLGKGGGYRPRPSDEVFGTNYGDCKDKTNLLQGLLKIKGIDVYPLIVYSGKTKIFENWPSSSQFNHCIAAIKVDDDFSSPAIIEHDELGKLLVFDPTSTFTPFGDIPYSLQGSKGILLAGEKGGLVSIPEIPLENSLLQRDIEMVLVPSGRAFGLLKESSTGQVGRTERRFAFTKDSDYTQLTKDWITTFHPGAEINEPKRDDDMETGHFKLEVEFGIPAFAKNMRNVLLTFKPVVLNRITSHPFGDEERKLPVDLDPYNLEETTQISLPENFEMSEMPENVSIETDFGSYSLILEQVENLLKIHRTIKMRATRVPVERYDELISFFEQRIKADQSTVVMEKR